MAKRMAACRFVYSGLSNGLFNGALQYAFVHIVPLLPRPALYSIGCDCTS
jgi:hypothetical protein